MSGNRYQRRFLTLWIAGLALFAIVIWLGWPLSIETVPGGILHHQSAGNAMRVNMIQQAWVAAGLYDRALVAMCGDILFITVYGLGSWYGGLTFIESDLAKLRSLGKLIAGAAAIFIATDYAETFAQIAQLWQMQGNDTLASLAATVRPVKIVAWLVTFFGISVGLVFRRVRARA